MACIICGEEASFLALMTGLGVFGHAGHTICGECAAPYAASLASPEKIVDTGGNIVCPTPGCMVKPKMPAGCQEAIAATIQRLEAERLARVPKDKMVGVKTSLMCWRPNREEMREAMKAALVAPLCQNSQCPHCFQEHGGHDACSAVRCGACGMHFCAVCLDVFKTSEGVHDHLRSIHGGVFLMELEKKEAAKRITARMIEIIDIRDVVSEKAVEMESAWLDAVSYVTPLLPKGCKVPENGTFVGNMMKAIGNLDLRIADLLAGKKAMVEHCKKLEIENRKLLEERVTAVDLCDAIEQIERLQAILHKERAQHEAEKAAAVEAAVAEERRKNDLQKAIAAEAAEMQRAGDVRRVELTRAWEVRQAVAAEKDRGAEELRVAVAAAVKKELDDVPRVVLRRIDVLRKLSSVTEAESKELHNFVFPSKVVPKRSDDEELETWVRRQLSEVKEMRAVVASTCRFCFRPMGGKFCSAGHDGTTCRWCGSCKKFGTCPHGHDGSKCECMRLKEYGRCPFCKNHEMGARL